METTTRVESPSTLLLALSQVATHLLCTRKQPLPGPARPTHKRPSPRGGWQLRAITAVEVKGGVAPGGVDDLLVTLERSDRHH